MKTIETILMIVEFYAMIVLFSMLLSELLHLNDYKDDDDSDEYDADSELDEYDD